MLAQFERLFHGLHFYGAAGITAFGWAVCRIFSWRAQPWLPLWFCAALLIYNADRLKRDPADLINVPLREAAAGRFRAWSVAVVLGASLVLCLWPVWRRDWLTLALIGAGALVCLNYSIPVAGFRLKAVPLLKTFFAPGVVTAAVFTLPWLREDAPKTGLLWGIAGSWLFLLLNMTLCDLRDIEGDRRTGIRSLPVLLGRQRTRLFLWALLTLVEGMALGAFLHAGERTHSLWLCLALALPVYLGALIALSGRPQSERFYEWWVEGMLFLPALACAALAL